MCWDYFPFISLRRLLCNHLLLCPNSYWKEKCILIWLDSIYGMINSKICMDRLNCVNILLLYFSRYQIYRDWKYLKFILPVLPLIYYSLLVKHLFVVLILLGGLSVQLHFTFFFISIIEYQDVWNSLNKKFITYLRKC